MRRTTTVLLLVAHLLMSSMAVVDRQWSPEDEKQHCLTQCNDECVEFNVPITCDINEKKCEKSRRSCIQIVPKMRSAFQYTVAVRFKIILWVFLGTL